MFSITMRSRRREAAQLAARAAGGPSDIYDVHPTRVGTLGDAAQEAKDTGLDVIHVLGWGLLIYVGLKYVAPTFLDAGKETRRASHELGMVGRHERERREDRNERLRREREDRDEEWLSRYESRKPRTIKAGNVPSRVVDNDVPEGVLIENS